MFVTANRARLTVRTSALRGGSQSRESSQLACHAHYLCRLQRHSHTLTHNDEHSHNSTRLLEFSTLCFL